MFTLRLLWHCSIKISWPIFYLISIRTALCWKLGNVINWPWLLTLSGGWLMSLSHRFTSVNYKQVPNWGAAPLIFLNKKWKPWCAALEQKHKNTKLRSHILRPIFLLRSIRSSRSRRLRREISRRTCCSASSGWSTPIRCSCSTTRFALSPQLSTVTLL